MLPTFAAFYAAGNADPSRTDCTEQAEYTADNDNAEDDEFDDDDEVIRETPEAAAERTRQFAAIKELLTTAELGAS